MRKVAKVVAEVVEDESGYGRGAELGVG